MTADLRRRALLANLVGQLQGLEYDALRVVKRVADRLVLGRERYGDLDLAKPRPWRRERNEELLDAIVYEVAGDLAKEDAAREQLHEQARAEMIGPVVPRSINVVSTTWNAGSNAWICRVGDPDHDWEAVRIDGVWFNERAHYDITDERTIAALDDAVKAAELRSAPVPEERRREALQLIGPVSIMDAPPELKAKALDQMEQECRRLTVESEMRLAGDPEPYESELEGPEYDFEGGGAG